jgi:outer membrane protein assembly factor BamA
MGKRGKGDIVIMLTAALLLSACSVSKFLPDDAYLLDQVKVVSTSDAYSSTQAGSSLQQKPNTRMLGLFRWPLRIYCLSGKSNNFVNRTLRNIGEAPRIYDPAATAQSCANIRRSLIDKGFLKAEVESVTLTKGRKAKVTYFVDPKEPYRMRSISYRVEGSDLAETILADTIHSLLQTGARFSPSDLGKERVRITENLHNLGYFTFQKDHVTFFADTAANSFDVDLTVRIARDPGRYIIDSVFYETNGEPFMREKLFLNHSLIRPGQFYNAQRVKDTYASFNRFGAVKYTNISFVEKPDSMLDCHITVSPAKKMSTNIELDGTNTAGDLGVSAGISFTNRNLFRGSELLTLKLRGAYESITRLSDYDGDHYIEYGADLGLNFPKLILPFVNDKFQARNRATTQLDLQWNAQDRPEFTRRVVSGSWSYLWNVNNHVHHRYDLLGVNFVSVPKKDQYFIDNYLNQYNSRNSIMKFNYEDLFIARTGYTFYYNSQLGIVDRKKFFTSYSVRAGFETAGNLLSVASELLGARKDSLGQYRVGGIAFAQYVKGDIAWTSNINFNARNAMAFHLSAGIAYPYGNARMLPFEKRYYAGGANNVRGWSLRSLGPGSYVARNGTIDYINQSGDVKLFASMEYRPHLFWKMDGALFVDAGNIWTIYNYDDQLGGQFRMDTFLKQIAVAYGVGLRLDLGFIVVRFDGGMKAINPAYESGEQRFPLLHPNFRRDFAWHFAVGYPF